MRRRLALLGMMALMLGISACAGEVVRQPGLSTVSTAQEMAAIFFNCGKADSILIRLGEQAALIDTGTDKAGATVVSRLKALGVEKLDYLIITHPHKDHIGGADKVLDAVAVDQVLMGPLTVDNDESRAFADKMREKGLAARIPALGENFHLGTAVFTVLGPRTFPHADENDDSLVLRLDYGHTSFLLAADAEKPALAELMAMPNAQQVLDVDVLKVPHHGQAEDNTGLFHQMVSPEIGVITCKPGTKDNLPEALTLDTLAQVGAQVAITGKGEVWVSSDGNRVWLTQSQP